MNKAILSVGAVAVIAAGGIGFYSHTINAKAKDALDGYVEDLKASGQFSDVSYESVNASFGGDLEIKNFTMTPSAGEDSVTFKSIKVDNIDYGHETPHHMNVNIEGLKIPENVQEQLKADNTPVAAYFKSIGVEDTVPLAINFSYDYDEANEQTQDSELSMGIAKFGRYEFKSTTKNIPIDFYKNSDNSDPMLMQMQVMNMLNTASFPSISMAYTDEGGLNDILDIMANEMSVERDEYKQQISSQAQMMAEMFIPPGMEAFKLNALTQLDSFLEGDKSLQISLNPEHGGSFQELQPIVMEAVMKQDYQAVIDLLKLDIVSK